MKKHRLIVYKLPSLEDEGDMFVTMVNLHGEMKFELSFDGDETCPGSFYTLVMITFPSDNHVDRNIKWWRGQVLFDSWK